MLAACNPFAPGLDDSPGTTMKLLSDQKTPDGIFQNLKYAYTLRDTSIYGQLLDGNFTFVYHEYDRSVDVTWGRDEEMRATSGLFQNAQRLDILWNDVVSSSIDSTNTRMMIKRGFNLTVTFNPSDIIYVDGYANLTLARIQAEDPWMIIRWNDESNN
ncbi:MAG: hypothetical protein EHM64_16475 [Ignavibacteriae bacterium]|nr:MAG: hypothetical protein EHM64_16475 [Ignavibacteriota bacterium]